jgi:hypothetical protein
MIEDFLDLEIEKEYEREIPMKKRLSILNEKRMTKNEMHERIEADEPNAPVKFKYLKPWVTDDQMKKQVNIDHVEYYKK